MKTNKTGANPGGRHNPPQRSESAAAGRISSTAGGRRSGRSKKMSARKRGMIIAGAILGVIVIIAGAGTAYVLGLIGHINNTGDQTIPSEYDLPTESLVNPVPEIPGIYNILLLGVDTRDPDSVKERTDSMMILTIDQVHGKLKLTSLQRDMLVYVPGVDEPKKINSVNTMGGPMLVMRVVNDTFRLNITQYMIVNMYGMEKIIDLAGGVWVDVKQAELKWLNINITEANDVFTDTEKSAYVTSPGYQLLNGRQAVGFARIRKLDSDYKRMERQRTVIQAMLTAFLDADLATKNSMLVEGFGLISTNMSSGEIIKIGIDLIPLLSSEIDQMQIPISGYFTEYSGSSWVNLCDYNGMIPKLQEFIFGKTYDFDPVKVIPGAPNSGVTLATPTPKSTTTTETTTVETTTETLPAETSSETSETVTETAGTDTTAQTTDPTATTTATAAPTTATTSAPTVPDSTVLPTASP